MKPMLFSLCVMLVSAVNAQRVPSPTLGAHVFVGQPEGLGEHPALTPLIGTQPTGSVFIAFNAGYADNASTPTDNYRNNWKALDGGLPYAGYGGAFNVRPYIVTRGAGGPLHRVSIDKHGHPDGELSLSFVEVMHASRVVAVARNYAAPSKTVSTDSIDVDGPCVLLAFWWGDGGVKRMNVQARDDFQIIDNFTLLPDESGVQGVVAWKPVTHAGRYRVSWDVSPVQGAALWLIAIR